MTQRLKVLISAYACRPNEGSEPGVGWNVVREVAKHHDVWVMTRRDNQPTIEAEMARLPIQGLTFIYCDTPSWLNKLNVKQRVVHLHYYSWQIQAYFLARQLHQEIDVDLVHHVTYVRYASPSFLCLLPIPFIWGPVGGGEATPMSFWLDFSLRGKAYEGLRSLACFLGELDPFVRLTARRSALARATTEDTARRLRKLGAQPVQVVSQLGLSSDEIAQLQRVTSSPQTIHCISIGRLLHWKGFHLGLQAFAAADLPDDAEYWIVGDGPERLRLQALTERLGITQKVKFWQKLSRAETLAKLAGCTALVHPSLHDSGGLVCLEAMAAGRPVICLDLGGPGAQVTEETGFKIPAHTPEQAVQDLSRAMTTLAQNVELRLRMGQAGQRRVREHYSWAIRGQELVQLYEKVLDQSQYFPTSDSVIL